jgi:Holliday junction resolvase RusA-like endonuclease
MLDSWNRVLYDDDSQIVDLVLRKRYTPTGSVGVQVHVVETAAKHVPVTRTRRRVLR